MATGTVFEVAANQTLVTTATFEDPELGGGGAGTLVKAGAGTLVVLATNQYSGPTRVLAGTLRLQADAPPAGAALWLDANDTATITADGLAKVSAWNDKSGNARHATQTNAAIQPTVITNAIPGRPVMRFAGGTQQLDVNLAFLANSPYTILGVEARTNTGTIFMLGTRSNATNNGLHFGYRNNTAFTLAQYANDLDAGVPGYTGQQFRVWNGMLDTAIGHSIYLNGTNLSNNANTTPFAATLGAGVVGNGYTTQNFHGDVGEILVYSRALSTAERKIAEAYLNGKWLDAAAARPNLLPAASPLEIAAGARLDLGGARQTVGSLADVAGAGGLVINQSAAAATLAVGQDGTDAAFSGSIQNGTGSVALVKTGAGTQSLHAANPFGGGTTISNGTLLVHGSIGTGAVAVAGGTLGGTGVVLGAVSSAGTVAPGPGVGRLVISNDYQQTGSLALELAGTIPGTGHDVLAVAGTATLGGALAVTTNSGFAPAAGQSFTVLTAGAVSGTFASTTLPGLASGLGWDVAYASDAVVLSVTGTVLNAPYDLWAQAIPNAALRGDQEDPDGDGYVNLWEYSQGTDPTNGLDGIKVRLVRTNNVYALKFNRATGAVDLVYAVEAAYGLTNNALWAVIASNQFGLGWEGDADVTETNSGAVRQVFTEDNDPTSARRGLRLRVTRP